MSDKVREWIRPEIREITAYHVPEASGLIKLDAMENPYTWPQSLVDAWTRRLGETTVNRYPDAAATTLKARISEVMEVPAEMSVLLGNGSDELIQLITMAVAEPGRAILAPEPGFAMYRMIAAFTGIDFISIPLREDFSLDMDAMREAILEQRPAVIFLAYPNNPTGNLFAEDEIREIIELAPGLVVVDEAYHAFAGASFMDRLPEYDNLLVMRTVSKLGLAGLRLGMVAGPQAWIQELDKLRLPYNINTLTQVTAEFALEHHEVFDEQTRRIIQDRESLHQALAEMEGIEPYPSRANFILFRVPAGRATEIFEGLRDAGILIKNLGANPGPLADCLRVTVGTPEENEAFLDALRKTL
mgnify:CR=1 FL=1